MAPLKRKRAQDEAPAAPEATTRRATRQTLTAPVPMQIDPEPRKRRRRANTNEEDEAPAPAKPPVKATRKHSPGPRGKENIPELPASKPEPPKQARQPAAPRAATATAKTNGQKSAPLAQPTPTARVAPASKPTKQPPPTVPQQHKATTKSITVATPNSRHNQPNKPPASSSHFPSPANPRGAALPSTDRNIDKVVLGDICFRAWYPSYYPKEMLGDHVPSPSTSTNSHHNDSHHNGKGGKDGVHHKHRDHHNPPAILDRLCVCPCCFKYSKELVSWWEHVRICEARAHVPGRRIYTHPKGQRTVLVPAPGQSGPTSAPTKTTKAGGGGRKGSSTAPKMVEEIVRDEGEWSIWEVDGEKEGLFCQNLSLFAKLFLDNKSVFFDVTGFNYFLLVYTPPSPAPTTNNPLDPSAPSVSGTPRIVGFFSKEKMSWDNNNLACILIFPPWQRKGLGSLLMGVSYEISRREGVLGGPEKPISDLGKKGYKRFWAGEIARWLLEVDLTGEEEKVVDVEEVSKGTWIAADDCLGVLRDMGVVEDAGLGHDPRRAVRDKDGEEGGAAGEGAEEVKMPMVSRVRVDKEAVRRWVEANGISLERTCDARGFVEAYAIKSEEEEAEG